MSTSKRRHFSLGPLLFFGGIATILLTLIFWWLFSENQKAKDFLTVLCCFVTMIGFVITIMQISQMRSNSEVEENTELLTGLLKIKKDATTLQNTIINQMTFTVEIVTGYITQCNGIINEMIEIKAKHNRIINCDNCIDSLTELNSNFDTVIEDGSFDKFKRRTYTDILRTLITQLSTLESTFKK